MRAVKGPSAAIIIFIWTIQKHTHAFSKSRHACALVWWRQRMGPAIHQGGARAAGSTAWALQQHTARARQDRTISERVRGLCGGGAWPQDPTCSAAICPLRVLMALSRCTSCSSASASRAACGRPRVEGGAGVGWSAHSQVGPRWRGMGVHVARLDRGGGMAARVFALWQQGGPPDMPPAPRLLQRAHHHHTRLKGTGDGDGASQQAAALRQIPHIHLCKAPPPRPPPPPPPQRPLLAAQPLARPWRPGRPPPCPAACNSPTPPHPPPHPPHHPARPERASRRPRRPRASLPGASPLQEHAPGR